jgi:ribosomal protein L37E
MSDDRPIDWEKGENVPPDAVQYWGKCRSCGAEAFVSPWLEHMCTQCVAKNRPSSTAPPVGESEPVDKDECPECHKKTLGPGDSKCSECGVGVLTVPQKDAVLDKLGECCAEIRKEEAAKGTPLEAGPWNEEPVKEPRKRGRPKGSRNKKPKTAPVKVEPGKWVYDDTKKGWVIRNDKGRVERFSKEKPEGK